MKLKIEFSLYFKGMFMGIADLIPGVSGGTIAFITGIYERLLNAIASLNSQNIKLLFRGQLKEFFSSVPLTFMATLMAGIMTSVILFSRLMHYLVTEQRVYTWSFFFGLVLASVPLLSKQVDKPFCMKNNLFFVFGALLSFFIVGLIPIQTPNDSWFIFLCGLIAISAMILPGISGSFLLLMLGKYEFITSAIKNPFAEGNMIILVVFSLGALTSLLSFCKGLSWTYKRFKFQTISFLSGVLLGSLRKLWPWKETVSSKIIRGKTYILEEANILPEITTATTWALLLIVFGIVLILWLDKYSHKGQTEV